LKSSHPVYTPFLRRFTDEPARELSETIALYNSVRAAHQASVWNQPDIMERTHTFIASFVGQLIDLPDDPVLMEAMDACMLKVLALETTIFTFPEIQWPVARLSMKEQVDLRRFLRAKEYFLANQDRVSKALTLTLGNVFVGLIQNLPPSAGESAFTVPLSALLAKPNDLVDKIIGTLNDEENQMLGLFTALQHTFYENVCETSGIAPYTETKRPLITANNSELPGEELTETYLRSTPFVDLLNVPVAFHVPEETRFSGQWIIAPPGRGKTTLLHSMFLDDAKRDASLIIMDSKGDLINPIRKLKGIQDRLVIIEPDADHPLALNPLNIPGANLTHTLALLEYVFGSLLEAKFTPLQLTLFRNVLPAIIDGIPNPTLAIFRDIIENGIKGHPLKLTADSQRFFDTQFNSKTYTDTRNQLIWRLDYLMTNPLMRAMFDAPQTKLDLGKEMDAGKIIIINNSKELLEEAGAEFFGRFFIALVRAAAQRRSSRPQSEKLPCFFYIDECHDVIKRDENISTIIDQCRSQKIALILAHQRTQQIESANVLSALSNCGIRYANSDDEAKLLADKLRTTPDFLRSLPRGSFAAFVRDLTPAAIEIKVPYIDVPALPQTTSAQQQALRERMRSQFSTRRTLQPQQTPAPAPDSIPERSPEPDPETRFSPGEHTEAGKDW
jgi:hypothetical protein